MASGDQGLHSAENGKKGGRPRMEGTKFREALLAEIEKYAKPLAEVLVKKGLAGEIPALREIADRAMGKPAQGVDVTTNGRSINIVFDTAFQGRPEIHEPPRSTENDSQRPAPIPSTECGTEVR
jgi:hypothetical protein